MRASTWAAAVALIGFARFAHADLPPQNAERREMPTVQHPEPAICRRADYGKVLYEIRGGYAWIQNYRDIRTVLIPISEFMLPLPEGVARRLVAAARRKARGTVLFVVLSKKPGCLGEYVLYVDYVPRRGRPKALQGK